MTPEQERQALLGQGFAPDLVDEILWIGAGGGGALGGDHPILDDAGRPTPQPVIQRSNAGG